MAATGQSSGGSIVSGTSIVAAGLASALAAAVTSSLGWAGGLIGAALTTMIITGGSAILNAYLQSMKRGVRAAPGSIRAAARRTKSQRTKSRRVSPDGSPPTLPDNPELRDNFVGRLRGALGWFSRLPLNQRRSILKRGLVGAAAAFVVGVVAITAVEFGIGNSLSCGLWAKCPSTSAPGIGGGNAYVAGGGGSGYTILANRSAGGVSQQSARQNSPQPGGSQQSGLFGGLFGGGDQRQTPQAVPQQGGGNQQPQQPQAPQRGGGVFGGGNQQQAPQAVPQQGGGNQQPQQAPQQAPQPQPQPQPQQPQQQPQQQAPQPAPQEPAQPVPDAPQGGAGEAAP